MIRLADGVFVHRAPFSGGFVVDAAHLAAVEIDDQAVDLLTRGEAVCEEDQVPAALRSLVAAGLAEGWLIADRPLGPREERTP